MYDLSLENDLQLDDSGDLIVEKYPSSLFRKAVLTPKSYISFEWAPDSVIDEAYGNAAYYKIQENITGAVISDLNTDIREAVSEVSVPLSNVTVQLENLTTIKYTLTYKDNSTELIQINGF